MQYNKNYEKNFESIIKFMCEKLKIEYNSKLLEKIINSKNRLNNELIFNNHTKNKAKDKMFFDVDKNYTDKMFLSISETYKDDIFFTSEKEIYYLIFCNLLIISDS